MMTFDRLSEDERDSVSKALAGHLGDYWRRRQRERPKEELPESPSFTLHESMRVSVLDLPEAPDPAAAAESYERGGQRWHHQIHVDGEPRLYARTVVRSTGDKPTALRHELVEIGGSAVVPKITRTLEALDEGAEEGADGVVRLLVAPSRAFFALAVVRDGRIDEVHRMAVSPREERDLAEGLMDPLARGKELLGVLAEIPSAYGIGDADGRSTDEGRTAE